MSQHAGHALLPFFLACVAVEALVLWRRKRALPEAGEVLTNLGCGIGQLAMRPLYELAITGLYVWVYEEARLFTVPASSLAAWALLFLATDLTYYAYHRLSHHLPFMWAWHGVHHQSPSYDLSVSFRLSWLGGPVERLFYVPFALIGFPPAMIVVLTGLSSFYQFFVHTRTVGRLGPLEWIFNTPSHHRVHHGIEPHYVDHNFGGVLCIWDRLLGTYVREGAEPTYGVVRPFASRSPFTANMGYWLELLDTAPARDERVGKHSVARATLGYVAVQLGLAALVVYALAPSSDLHTGTAAASVAFVVLSTITLGAMLDGLPWARNAEVARWTAAALAAAWLDDASTSARVITMLAAAGSVAWLLAVSGRGVSLTRSARLAR